MVYAVNNTANGNEVAEMIGLFVNSLKYPSEDFYKLMLQRKENVKHNFTVLCIEWFKKLANTKRYDGRNEASVSMAKDIAMEFEAEVLSKRRMSSKGILPECVNEILDDTAAIRIIEKYLRLSSDNEQFIYTMLYYVHLTNQQSFSKMCAMWLDTLSNEQSKKQYVLWAKRAVKYYRYLPMV